MRARLERRAHRWWYERARPPWPLRPLAAVYGRLSSGRLGRPSGRPPVPVIVIGNLTAGGSGKTPVVEALVRDLAEAGHAVAVISRGYGGRPPKHPHRVETGDRASVAGDEALAVHRATGVPTWIDPDRRAALDAAVAAGAEVVVSDDGLQHRALPRSFEICVIDGRRGFGNGALLPAGPLREPLSRLASVDAILVKAPQRAAIPVDGESFTLRPTGIRSCADRSELGSFGQTIDAVAGIADPAGFFESLRTAGFELRRHRLADHAPIDPDWLAALPGPVVMTTKDAARLDRMVRDDLYVATVRAELPDALLGRVRAHVREFGA
ncbi:tetraacyldisaccharide 4'-kinase [Wenzhouxiangella sp. XN79A]|nr:tetraacyldisaccharide 4'-kinase [Wenzhouxiangella sp. XN79A]